jgi:hypothetical protein
LERVGLGEIFPQILKFYYVYFLSNVGSKYGWGTQKDCLILYSLDPHFIDFTQIWNEPMMPGTLWCIFMKNDSKVIKLTRLLPLIFNIQLIYGSKHNYGTPLEH